MSLCRARAVESLIQKKEGEETEESRLLSFSFPTGSEPEAAYTGAIFPGKS